METIGIVGAGTMGSGIAQLAAQHGHRVILCDVERAYAERGLDKIRSVLARSVEKERIAPEDMQAALARITPTAGLNALAAAAIVIEAAAEDLEVKRGLFAQLDAVCPPETVLASNTSSLSIAALAGATRRPDKVAGMHFFNPPALMALVEVVCADATGAATRARLVDLARRWGKTPVVAGDTPGFIVNRVARPFYLEALRLLGEGAADAATIDRIVRGGGFRMGPFELMDLIGVDVNFAVTQSVYRAFFESPRYRPHPIQQRMVDSGRLGRKTGRGFYDHARQPAPAAAQSVAIPPDWPLRRHALLIGDTPQVDRLAHACVRNGWNASVMPVGHALAPDGIGRVRGEARQIGVAIEFLAQPIEAKRAIVAALDAALPTGALILSSVWSTTATHVGSWTGRPGRVVGFAALPPLGDSSLVEIAAGLRSDPAQVDRAAAFFASLGLETARVNDSAGAVLPRIVCGLVNEAATALAEGVASAEDIDMAMRLGTNYPLGPLAWGDLIGLDAVLAVMDGLRAEAGDDRHAAAPILRQYARAGWLGQKTGRGFFEYAAD